MKKSGYRDLGSIGGIKWLLTDLYTAPFTRKALFRQFYHVTTSYNKNSTTYCFNAGSSYAFGRERYLLDSLVGKLPTDSFEGIDFPIPQNPERILNMLYGDCMKPPPEDKRYNRHRIVEIDTGN